MDALRELMSSSEDIEPDTSWAWFTSFSSYSQDILLQCFTRNNDFQEFLRVRHNLMLAVRTRFNEMGLEFAFPTQVEYQGELRKQAPQPAPDPDLPDGRQLPAEDEQ